MNKLLLVTVIALSSASAINAQMLYKDSHVFVGQKPTNYNSVGTAPGVYIGPNFGIEYSENGLNIWRPYPSSNYGNYKIFLDETGKVGIGRKPTLTQGAYVYALTVNDIVLATKRMINQ